MALAVSVMATATGTASANPRVSGDGVVRRAPKVEEPSTFSILGKTEQKLLRIYGKGSNKAKYVRQRVRSPPHYSLENIFSTNTGTDGRTSHALAKENEIDGK